MKVKQPDIYTELPEVRDTAYLMSAREEEETVAHLCLRELVLSETALDGLSFHGVVLEGCRFISCSLEKADFIDVRFHNCDFSNCAFHESYFSRCDIQGCKGVGADFGNGKWQNVTVADCNFRYAGFDRTSMHTVQITDSSLYGANMAGCTLKNLMLQQVDCSSVSFFQTPLKGLDFTTCHLDGIVVSGDFRELRGAIVNPYQAAELAKLMGLVIH